MSSFLSLLQKGICSHIYMFINTNIYILIIYLYYCSTEVHHVTTSQRYQQSLIMNTMSLKPKNIFILALYRSLKKKDILIWKQYGCYIIQCSLRVDYVNRKHENSHIKKCETAWYCRKKIKCLRLSEFIKYVFFMMESCIIWAIYIFAVLINKRY